jgi:hypothetical protein
MIVRLSVVHTSLYLPQEGSWHSFLVEAESTPGAIMWLEESDQLKIPVTSMAVKPMTFWFVA